MIKAITVQAFVDGVVQGVGFRYCTMREAESLGLTGYAHNLSDGRVEIKVTGPAETVEKLIAWLECGPSTAHVEQLQWQEVELETFTCFRTN